MSKYGRFLSLLLAGTLIFTSADMTALAAETQVAEETVVEESGEPEVDIPETQTDVSEDAEATETEVLEDEEVVVEDEEVEEISEASEVSEVSEETEELNGDFDYVDVTAQCDVTSEGLLKGFKSGNTLTSDEKKYITFDSTVKTIDTNAFQNDTDIIAVKLPESVTDIRVHAFYGCSNLIIVNFEESKIEYIRGCAFTDCPLGTADSLGTIVLPSTIKVIGNDAFNGCKYIGTVKFTNVEGAVSTGIDLGSSAFKSCENLTKITLSNNVVTLPNYFATECKKLTTVEWDENLQEIGLQAFWDDVLLTTSDFSSTKLTTIGDSAFYQCTALLAPKFPSTLTTISQSAFSGDNLGTNASHGEIVIPNSVTSIGTTAFQNCQYLAKVTFEAKAENDTTELSLGTYMLKSCSALKEIVFSEKVVKIPTQFACGDEALEKVTLSKSITTIGDSAFCNCTNLANVNINDATSLEKIEISAFASCPLGTSEKTYDLVLPKTISEIKGAAFNECKWLASVTFTDVDSPSSTGVSLSTDNKAGMFENCPNLKKITLSNNVVKLPGYFASSCSALETVVWGSNLEEIGQAAFYKDTLLSTANFSQTKITTIGINAFEGVTALEAPKFPATLTTIGKYAFEECNLGSSETLGEITIPKSVTTIGEYAFSDSKYLGKVTFVDASSNGGLTLGDDLFKNGKSIKEITLSNKITSTGREFAYGCSLLEKVTFNSNLETIGSYAFYKCTNLGAITLPSSLTTIGSYAFISCNLGTKDAPGELVIPAKVTSIGNNAFASCTYLRKITFTETSSAITLDYRTFYDCPALEEIIFAKSLTTIPSSCAGECPKLTAITIPDTVTTITSRAFYVSTKNSAKIATAVTGSSDIVKNYNWSGDNRAVATSYSVVFNANYGTTPATSTQTIVNGLKTTLAPNSFTRNGYAFVKWTTNADGTGKSYNNKASVTNLAGAGESITLYAQWKVTTYNVTLHGNGGLVAKSSKKVVKLAYEASLEPLADIAYSNPGFDFKGYSTTADGATIISADQLKKATLSDPTVLDYYVIWAPKTYAIILDAGVTDATAGKIISGNGTENAASFKSVIANGHTATTTPTVGDTATAILVEYGEYIKLTGNEFSRPGYTLTGFSSKENGKGTKYKFTDQMLLSNDGADITLYAVWKLDKYTITYNLDGGKNGKGNPKTYSITSDAITLTAPTKTGTTFAKWTDENGNTITSIDPKTTHRNIVLTANYNDISYKLVLDAGTEHTSTSAITKTVKYTDTLDFLAYSKEFTVKSGEEGSYGIIGFATKENSKSVKYSVSKTYSKLSKTDGAEIKLYAVWGPATYAITYVMSDSETEVATNNKANPLAYSYNAKKAVSIKAPSRPGYVFDKWTATGDGASSFSNNSIAKGAKGAITLTASWKAAKYTVTINKNNNKATYSSGKTAPKYTDVEYTTDKTFDASVVKNTYYDLEGFNTKANGKGTWVYPDTEGKVSLAGLATKDKAKVTLYAIWSVHTFKITYINIDPNKALDETSTDTIYKTSLKGVKNTNPTEGKQISAITLKKPSKTRYTFVGWYSDAGCTKQVKKIDANHTGDITLYGKWKVN